MVRGDLGTQFSRFEVDNVQNIFSYSEPYPKRNTPPKFDLPNLMFYGLGIDESS